MDIPFDFFFSVLSATFFGMLTLYTLRTYLFFKESSLAHHLIIISVGMALFTIGKFVGVYQVAVGPVYPFIVDILQILGAIAILFGIIDFRREFVRFRWLKEIQDQIDIERKRWKSAK